MSKLFKQRCVEAANVVEAGTADSFDDLLNWDIPKGTKDQYEDDGNLHIEQNGLHVSFDVGRGQTLSGEKQNENTRKVMLALGLAKKINWRVLVEEDDYDDDEETCEHCGHLL